MSIQQDEKAEVRPDTLSLIILAAGRGTRMGGRPKLLLPLGDGLPLIRHTVLNALSVGAAEAIVVVRPDLPEIVDALAGLPVRFAPSPRYTEGMALSLAAGISALAPHAEAALIMLGDEPSVHPYIIKQLILTHSVEGKLITMPMYGDTPGPPTIFSREVFPRLLELEGDAGGRQLAEAHPEWVCFVPFEEAMRPRDLDTPEDYRAFL